MSRQRQGDIEELVRKWATEAIQAQDLGDQAKCQLVSRAQYMTTIGHVEGSEGPTSGMEAWLADLDVYFPDAEPDMGLYAARILDAVEAHSRQRVRLGDSIATVSWRDTDGDSVSEPPNAPAGFPFKATVFLSVQVI